MFLGLHFLPISNCPEVSDNHDWYVEGFYKKNLILSLTNTVPEYVQYV